LNTGVLSILKIRILGKILKGGQALFEKRILAFFEKASEKLDSVRIEKKIISC